MHDDPALRPDLAVGDTLVAVARDILAEARIAIEDQGKPDSKAVHDFRRQMKRWRALLRLLKPFLGEDGTHLRLRARDLARALGGARDAQSALDALMDLAHDGLALSPRSLATLRDRIEDLRQTAETTILTGDMRLSVAAALDDAEAAIATWPLDRVAFTEIAQRLGRGYRSARNARPAVWSQADAEELHELRKRVVNHRYQFEIVQPLWPRFIKMWVGEAQRLRERLGKHQDLLVLARLTNAHQPLAHWRSRLAAAIEQRKVAHVAASERIARRLFLEKPKAFRRRLEAIWLERRQLNQ
jgi:CHAD domain-containing protein